MRLVIHIGSGFSRCDRHWPDSASACRGERFCDHDCHCGC